jgi:hypothetical protein
MIHFGFFNALQAAEAAALRGDRAFVFAHLKTAQGFANKIDDKQYRKLVFRAFNWARTMPNTVAA